MCENNHVQSLEPRRHLASSNPATTPIPGCCCGACLSAQAVNRFELRVNFSPEDAPRARGHRLDYGARFDTRANGITYGWNRDKTDQAVYNKSVDDKPRNDSHISMNRGDSWSVQVPNGWYNVYALMGDSRTLGGNYRLRAEGNLIVNGKPYTGFPFIEGTGTVHVTDGRLTIASDSRAQSNRLASVSVKRTTAPVNAPRGANINWVRNNSIKSPVSRVESGSVRVGNSVFFLGGFTNGYDSVTNRVDILNIKTNKWTRGANMPGPETHSGTATDGRYIYAAGGQTGPLLSINGTSRVYRYDIKRDRWQRFVRLPEVRFLPAMAIVDGKLHAFGGNDATRVIARAEHWAIDLSNPSAGWQSLAPLPVATDHHSSIVVNNQIYAMGGETGHGTSYIPNDFLARYDAKRNRWTSLAPMPTGASHNEAGTLTDGKRIFLLAGQENAQQIFDQVRSYDIAKNRWVIHTELPTARKGGVSWIEGKKLFYTAGDDDRFGQPTWTYVGTIQ